MVKELSKTKYQEDYLCILWVEQICFINICYITNLKWKNSEWLGKFLTIIIGQRVGFFFGENKFMKLIGFWHGGLASTEKQTGNKSLLVSLTNSHCISINTA